MCCETRIVAPAVIPTGFLHVSVRANTRCRFLEGWSWSPQKVLWAGYVGLEPSPWIRPRQNRGSYEWNFSVNVSLISLAKPITLKTHHQILCSTAPPLIRIPNPSNPSKNNSAHHMLSPPTHLTGFVSVGCFNWLLDHRFA